MVENDRRYDGSSLFHRCSRWCFCRRALDELAYHGRNYETLSCPNLTFEKMFSWPGAMLICIGLGAHKLISAQFFIDQPDAPPRNEFFNQQESKSHSDHWKFRKDRTTSAKLLLKRISSPGWRFFSDQISQQ